jgi:hypothetical protein
MTSTFIVDNVGGISGSLTNLVDGSSYLVAGDGISILSGSNGSVAISALPVTGSVVGDYWKYKTTDQTVIGTTLTDDVDFHVDVPANSIWFVTFDFIMTTGNHPGGSTWALDAPAGSSLTFALYEWSPTGVFGPSSFFVTSPGATFQPGNNSPSQFVGMGRGTVFIGPSSGSIKLQFCEAFSSTGATMQAGSVMHAKQIG